ncbi:copper resistance protein CopC [Robertmurraya massiliosenegalensis]|uniref:copper resistance CopC family protein n=1 Tax=Robertmurraya TaxID=2837507 RepID=UPI0039A4D343
MKRIFIAVLAIFLAISVANRAFAHSHLEGSNPADGEVVTEALSEIVLDFEGDIEQGSFVDVTTTDGQAVELQETEIVEHTLTATVAEPFANGEYQVSWSILSADGHSLEGEFSFTVDAPVSENVNEESEEPVESTEENEDIEAHEQTVENEESANSENGEEEESSSMILIFVVLFVVLVAGGVIYFTRRKK